MKPLKPVLILSALLVAHTGRGATLTVTSLADSGAGTLRSALGAAANGDTINFMLAFPATITLTNGQLLIEKSVAVVGPGPAGLTISGNHASRVFRVSPSNTVSISGFKIANGAANFLGGGGIYNDHATLALSNCTISGNVTTNGYGGGIYSAGYGSGGANLTIVNSTINGNVASSGGGIFSDGESSGSATANLINSTISGNSATNGNGGGIYCNGGHNGDATLRIIKCTLSGNAAAGGNSGGGAGGGIFNNGFTSGRVTNEVNNSTLSGNTALAGGGIVSDATSGGIATLKVGNCTFDRNEAGFWGGGITVSGPSAGVSLLEIGTTLLKRGASGENIFVNAAAVISRGYNLCSDAAGGDAGTSPGGLLNATGDQRNTDPLLDPAGLKDNGGPTQTIALRSGSPAIDKGKRDTIAALASNTDQRGELRPFDDPNVANASGGDSSDIGAYEASVRITAAEKLGNNLRLSFTSVLGRNHELESRPLAESGTWSSLPGSVSGNGGIVQSTVTNAFNQAKQFYRVIRRCQETLDQQQSSGSSSAGSLDQWQSFTAGRSGSLTKIELWVGSPTSPSASPGTIRIYAGEGTSGPLLATESVTFSDPSQFQTFVLHSPPGVTAGSQYTIRFGVPSQSVGWVNLSTANPYAGGRASMDPSWDYAFKTYVAAVCD